MKCFYYWVTTLLFTMSSIGNLEAKGTALVLDEHVDSGMFASFGAVLGALHLFDQGQVQGVHIDFKNGHYYDPDKGSNWWEYYFKPIHVGDPHAQMHHCSPEEILKLSGTGFFLKRFQAYRLIKKYIKIKPELQKEISKYYQANFASHYVIGLHHRGTDKIVEWPLVAYEKTWQTLINVIQSLTEKQKARLRVYVATDDQLFLNFLASLLPNLIIYNDFVRSANGDPLHYGNQFYASNYEKGKEALLDCIFLAQSHLLIRPNTSSFSLIATFFNPFIPLYNISPFND
ncbi:MAG: nodulation protein NodZ [Parachlamydiaceae bacterium]